MKSFENNKFFKTNNFGSVALASCILCSMSPDRCQCHVRHWQSLNKQNKTQLNMCTLVIYRTLLFIRMSNSTYNLHRPTVLAVTRTAAYIQSTEGTATGRFLQQRPTTPRVLSALIRRFPLSPPAQKRPP